jgi:peptidoglycan/xylan/chitin deacetylase (PgdA/CDA1 family)
MNSPGGPGTVCLTFDDGPDPDHTPRLLDALNEHDVPAIFFLIGYKAEAHPAIVRRIVDEGHVVGNHSYGHPRPGQIGAWGLVAEALRTQDLLAENVGRGPRLFRPPYGSLSPCKLAGLWLARQTVVLWNTDPKDFAVSSSDELRDWVLRHPLLGGEIVLLHDCWPYAADVIPALAAGVRDRGLSFFPPRPKRSTRPATKPVSAP